MLSPDIFSAEWLITLYYLVILTLVILVAKVVSTFVAGRTLRGEARFLLLAPVLSISSWQQMLLLGRPDKRSLLYKGVIFLPLMVIVFLWVPTLTSDMAWWVRSYLAILPFWLLIETIQLLVELCWSKVNRSVPPISQHPLVAKSVADFWGRRWNRLFGDWFRQVCFRPLARQPILALTVTFVISGLIHELLVSLPLWFVYRVNCFGWMVGYFLLQLLAILIERQWLRQIPRLNRPFVWLVVLIPAPLILNQGTLLIFHLAIMS